MFKQKKHIKIFIYAITILIMIISSFVFLFSFLNSKDDIFMDGFLLIIDLIICLFLLFCEFEIGNCIVYFLTQKKSRLNMLFKTLVFSSSISWILMLIVMYNSTNVFLSELLLLFFSVLLLFSKLMCLLTKSK